LERLFKKSDRTKHDTNIDPNEKLLFRNGKIPDDYHTKYLEDKYIGEIYNTEENRYYSQVARRKYYDTKAGTHLCPGHFLGYRFAIQKYTKEGDWVFDPTVGTGTAIIEAINNGRNGVGIELEFPDIARKNIAKQYQRELQKPTGKNVFIHGNAKDINEHFNNLGIRENHFKLIMNGTPYPTLGSISSDAPERKSFDSNNNSTFDYNNVDNFGKKKGEEYWEFITNMYLDSIPYLKSNGKLVILIKDMTRDKKPYLLHKMIVERLLDKTKELEIESMYLHKHIPETMFMRTYPKQYPDAEQIPLYQTGVVLNKK